MKMLAVVMTLGIALLLVSAVLAGASSVSLQETDLAASGEAYEVNLGADGYLYVSDYSAKQIWRVNPANLGVTKYQLTMEVSDARPDSAGNIWFTDGGPTFARLNPNTNQAVYWEIPDTLNMHNLQGTVFDASGKLWMTEWINFESKIYRFDISSTGLCTYTLPLDGVEEGSSQSFYILSQSDKLWIANRGEQRIYRLDTTLDQATWWQIPDTASRPVGIALDSQTNLWWADEGLGALARLEPATDEMTRYNLPNTAKPNMLLLHNGAIWYTAAASSSPGYLGALFPEQTTGITSTLNSQTYPASKQCTPSLGAGTPTSVSVTTPTPSWSPADLSLVVNTSAWQVYQLPSGSIPYGLALENDNLWMTDQGRKKLMRLPLSATVENKIYLPLARRNN